MQRPHKCSFMIATIVLIAAGLFGSGCTTTPPPSPQAYNSELEYLKSLHQAGPITDPQLVVFFNAAVHECQPAARRHRVL